MSPRHWITSAALFVPLMLAAGCGTPPKPPPPPEEKTAWEEPDAGPEQASKKCEALEEKCKSAADTKARIAKASFTITPVPKWTYAQGANATVAQASDVGATFVVAGYEVPDPKKEIPSRESTLDGLAKEVGVTLPKKKINWKKPDATEDAKGAAGVKVNMWETEGATRKDKKGTLLVFAASLPEKQAIVGFGFVPDEMPDAEKETLATDLQNAITSIAPREGAGSSAEK